jgi:hypothetical protein
MASPGQLTVSRRTRGSAGALALDIYRYPWSSHSPVLFRHADSQPAASDMPGRIILASLTASGFRISRSLSEGPALLGVPIHSSDTLYLHLAWYQTRSIPRALLLLPLP